jgi:hypothetical protein
MGFKGHRFLEVEAGLHCASVASAWVLMTEDGRSQCTRIPLRPLAEVNSMEKVSEVVIKG